MRRVCCVLFQGGSSGGRQILDRLSRAQPMRVPADLRVVLLLRVQHGSRGGGMPQMRSIPEGGCAEVTGRAAARAAGRRARAGGCGYLSVAEIGRGDPQQPEKQSMQEGVEIF